MPTYEYECRSCGHEFEVFQSITDGPKRKCPECGKGVRRLVGAGSAVIFKGSGFYQTDYRSSEYKEKASADSKSETKGADTSKKDSDTPKKEDKDG